jgi:hypothetical protein
MKKLLCTIILSLFAFNTFAAFYDATTTSHAKKWKHIKHHHLCKNKVGCDGSGEYHPAKVS